MGLDKLMAVIREAAPPRVWGAAVELARSGAVEGVSDDGEEVHLRVKARGRALPHEVYLWPEDEEWGCDCTLPSDPCLHVCAGVIAANRAGTSLPAPEKTFRVRLRYAFETVGDTLKLERLALYPSGSVEPLVGTLSEANLLASRGDVQAESLLAMHPGGPLPAQSLRRLLAIVEDPDATLDGDAVTLSTDPIVFPLKVEDAGEGFKVRLVRPPDIDRLYRGAARVGDTLHPTSHGGLNPEQRRVLIQGVTFSPDEVGRLVGDYLPRLREKVPVLVATTRLPEAEQLEPKVRVTLSEKPGGLEVSSQVVYGDVAVVEKGVLKPLGDVVPSRDMPAERLARRTFESRTGLVAGLTHLLPPEDAVNFLNKKLPLHNGPVKGRIAPDRFRVTNAPLLPRIEVKQDNARGAWELDATFAIGESGEEADVYTVLSAWRSHRSLVPLLDGGYAPLPADWLRQHGALLQELLDARDANGRVTRNATAALVELLEDTEGDVPTDLRRLQSFLSGDDGLPDDPLPDGFQAELRPYQHAGYRWLRFLAHMDLSGILADDMGLGKTVQALAALSRAGGQSLVVAPTSVLQNWKRESNRFTPNLSVNVYHGPDRVLTNDDLTLTSFALLRLDLEALREREWTYVVLDEAQAIKNPQSQTARAACKLRAKHRLALTGTPVENRLEELWSQFRFLMPGLLGGLETFRERFTRPIEAGERKAREALRTRIRPYVLRRLKQQVARDLPPLTEVVVRCSMKPEQRKVYDAVRLTARADVQKALSQQGRNKATFQILEALLRMRQAACDPRLLPASIEHTAAPSAKLDRLEELLVEIVCEDHKALIFSQWTSLLDRVEERLAKLGVDHVRLDGSTRDRQGVVDSFQDPSGPPVFLLSLKAGGTGLNLTAADYVVHLDPWWNPAVEQQATDRAHRIGQDKPVVSLRLIAEGTVEERVLDLQDAKRDLADAALGGDGGFVRALNADELRALFA